MVCRILPAGVLLGVIVALVRCSDECSSDGDCPGFQICSAGECRTRTLPPVLTPDRGIPDDLGITDLGDPMDMGQAADGGGGAPDASQTPRDVQGFVEVADFGPVTVATGSFFDFQGARVDVSDTDAPGLPNGDCRLIRTVVVTPPTPVGVEGVDVSVSRVPQNLTFTLESSVGGFLVPQVVLDTPLFEPSVPGTVTFDVRGGATGQPEDILGVQLAIPFDFNPLFPLDSSIDVASGVTFSFSPQPPMTESLVLRIVDTAGLELRCEVDPFLGTTLILPEASARAFLDADPREPAVLDLGYVRSRTEMANVVGGGDAQVEFRVFRGVRYSVVLP